MRIEKPLFVTGTDTDVGKTIIASALFRQAIKQGLKVAILKPIQTGCNPNDFLSDTYLYHRAVSDLPNEYEIHCLEWFKTPCSPALAAKLEGRTIDLSNLISKIKEIGKKNDLLIMEGAGGILVPIDTNGSTMLNLMMALSTQVLVVAKNRLGAINNALLSINELKRNGLTIAAVIMNQPKFSAEDSQYILDDNINQISSLSGLKCIGIPFMKCLASKDIISPIDFESIGNLMIDIGLFKKSTETSKNIIAFDRKHLLHPYDSPKNPQPVEHLIYAQSCELHTADGKQLVDGISSWWTAIHGHNNRQLNDHLIDQINKFSHIMFGGFTHEPAVELGQRLLEIVPKNLQKIFYSDSGSVAVEVAMKITIQYWQSIGNQNKTKFFSLAGGYHGDTLWAMSVCDPIDGMHRPFEAILPKQIFLPKPTHGFGKTFDKEKEIKKYEKFFVAYSQEIAGMIFEPIAQCAGGFWFYAKEYLEIFRNLCTKYHVLLIADEIATGFGRTGQMFACNFARIQPDIMCLGKGLTGGALSLGVTLTTEKITDSIGHGNPILHGPTFMANPLACSAGIASLSLLSKQDWHGQVLALQDQITIHLAQLKNLSGVKDQRVLGSIGVVEMDKPVDRERFTSFCLAKGVWLRPVKNIIYLMPPYGLTKSQLAKILSTISEYLSHSK
ncbi:MAG: adenosylmethionine--8-amino-7-oxononanoate transaminase [Puniceicoccales bacterium]|jgi:adenosylmethionine-8-amino-7-oxononanoate aminotransferase|nr:adenosylmethionine--8-amino-7-oxononanoate transaminase [Puniceicoccales bacterium]